MNIKQSIESVRAAALSNRCNKHYSMAASAPCHNATLFDLYFAHSASSLFKPTTMAAVGEWLRGWPAPQPRCRDERIEWVNRGVQILNVWSTSVHGFQQKIVYCIYSATLHTCVLIVKSFDCWLLYSSYGVEATITRVAFAIFLLFHISATMVYKLYSWMTDNWLGIQSYK